MGELSLLYIGRIMTFSEQDFEDQMDKVTTLKEAIRAGVDLARSEWDHGLSENQKSAVDERIDRKIDKVKVWLFSAILLNLVPMGIMVYQVGSFTTEMRIQLATLEKNDSDRYGRIEHEAYAREVDRRFDEIETRVDDLESRVFKGK